MSRQWQIVNDVIADANLILEVLDARDPNGTRNKRIEKLILSQNDKKLLLVLNKIDLVPKDVANEWRKLLQSEFPTIAISGTRGFERTLRLLRKKILQFAPSLPVYVAIVGYSNVGKSTIINGLKGAKIVGTSPQAGFTRGKQYINLTKNIRLIDSPGIIPIEGDELELALKAVITPEKIKNVDAVVAEIMNRTGPSILSNFYKLNYIGLDDLLEKLAKRRGKILPGGIPDMYEAAKIVIRDFQRGQIPYYTLPNEQKN
ncbi:MAG: 50S ribosome-binding GTPase [Candidatus Helarchaeota archaeon]|nr:50S ribosome-binding GTPase [Candidatus Helarchaeota archaeon]